MTTVNQNHENQFMQLSDLTNFENNPQRPVQSSQLNYEPISFDESDYTENSESFHTEDYLPEGNNIQMAIDDYVDPNQPINISNKQRENMQSVYELLKKQKEEERASIGDIKFKKKGGKRPPSGSKRRPKTSKSSKSKQLYIPLHKKKKKHYIKSTDRHFDDGGWNHDTRTTGKFDNLNKDELKREKLQNLRNKRKQRRNSLNKGSGGDKSQKIHGLENLQFKKSSDQVDPNALYFTDMDQIHGYLENVDDANLQLEAQNGILKMENLEKALAEEQMKRKVKI